MTFDENFARATGARASAYNMVMACLTAVTIVIGMRLVGSLLISSLIIFPPLTAMRVCKTFRHVVFSSAILGVICVITGIVLSFLLDVPASACIVLTNLAAYLVFSAAGVVRAQIGRHKT